MALPTQLPLLPFYVPTPDRDPIQGDHDRHGNLTMVIGEYTALRGISYALHCILGSFATATIVVPDDGTMRARVAADICGRFLAPSNLQAYKTLHDRDSALQAAAARGDVLLVFKDRDTDLRRIVAGLRDQHVRVHVRSPHGLPVSEHALGPARPGRQHRAA